MLEAHAISVRRGRRRLIRQLSLRAGPGDVIHVVGRNGAGKSTLLSALMGLRALDDGAITWDGQPADGGSPALRRDTWYLSHRNGVSSSATALEALALQASVHGVDHDQLDDVLGAVGLRAQASRAVGRLSAGQRRRLALARLWLQDRRLWMLDEPMTALDADGCAMLEAHVRVHREQGGIVILTSHQPINVDNVHTLTLS